MTRVERPRYNRGVMVGIRRGAAAAALAILGFLALAGAARADEAIGVGPNPVLNVQLTSGALTVKTWNRDTISIATQGSLAVRHIDANQVDAHLHRQLAIWSQTVNGPKGAVRLPPETFLLPKLAGATHDAVVARGHGNTTIYVPRTAALIVAHLGDGRFALQHYSGAFVAHVRVGSLVLDHVAGTGFAEVLKGPVFANDSDFARLRVRTALGNMYFRGCTSNQIEATSSYGSIVYDNGKFKPGLAHFSSEHGNVALGVHGGSRVQIGAHTGGGKIISNLHAPALVRRSAAGAPERFSGGAPIVTTNAKHGSIYLYNGSIRANPAVRKQLIRARALPAIHPFVPQPPVAHPPPPHPHPQQQHNPPPHRHNPPA